MTLLRFALVAGLLLCVGCAHPNSSSPQVGGASEARTDMQSLLQAQPPDSLAYLRAKSDYTAAVTRYRVAEAAWEQAGRPAVLQQALEPFRTDVEHAKTRFDALDKALIRSPVESVVGTPVEALPAGVWVHVLLMDSGDQREVTIFGVSIKLDDLDCASATCALVLRRYRDKTKCSGLRVGDELLNLGFAIRVAEINLNAKAVRLMLRQVGTSSSAAVSSQSSSSADDYIKSDHSEQASVSGRASATSRLEHLREGEPSPDVRAEGNPGIGAAVVVVRADRLVNGSSIETLRRSRCVVQPRPVPIRTQIQDGRFRISGPGASLRPIRYPRSAPGARSPSLRRIGNRPS